MEAEHMNITLTMAISSNPRTWPILEGTVKPDGIDLVPIILRPSKMFWRQEALKVPSSISAAITALSLR